MAQNGSERQSIRIIKYFCCVRISIKELVKTNWLYFIAATATLLVYSVFIRYGYISWDDPEMVFKNKDVQDFTIAHFFTKQYVGNYLPLTMLSHAIVWQVAGDHAGLHHLFSILLHLLNGWLVWRLGRALFKQESAAALGMLIFLLHPLQLEAVGWISEFKTLVYSAFFLSGLLSYVHYRRDRKTTRLVPVLLYFIAACLSKPSAVVFPLVLLLIDYLQGERKILLRLLPLLPFLLIGVVAGLINIYTQNQAQFINQAHAFPYWQRLAFAGVALGRYLLLFLFPGRLSIIYPYPIVSAAAMAMGFVMIVLFIVGLFSSLRKKNTLVFFSLLFFLIQLLLVLQFIPFGEVLYADRYMYLPLIALGWLLGNLGNSLKLSLRYTSLLLIILLSFPSAMRARDWRSALVLFEDILSHYPDSFVALNSAGVECMYHNEDTKALRYFDKAIQVNTQNYKGFYNRGLLALKTGDAGEAIKSFNRCLALFDYVKAYSGRAGAYYQLHDFSKAMEDAEHAVALDPGYAKSYFILGNCYNDLHQMDQALDNYNKAIALQPEDADYYFKRAIAFGKKQDFATCLSDLEVCTHLNPLYHEAYYWKGVAKVNLGKSGCEDFMISARQNFEPAVAAYTKYCR